MSDPRNVAHDKKVVHEKQKHQEDLAEGAAHVLQSGKKTARKELHDAHKENRCREGWWQHCRALCETQAASKLDQRSKDCVQDNQRINVRGRDP
jgi:hypothetical protein